MHPPRIGQWTGIAAFVVAAVTAHTEPLFDAAFLYYGTSANRIAVAVADVNSDSRPDVLLAGATQAGFEWFFGRGDGTFVRAPFWHYDELPVTSLALADLNGDGKPDAVLGSPHTDDFTGAGRINIAWGYGNGDFGWAEVPVYGPVDAVAAGDLDGGAPDIVAAHTTRDRITLLRNNGMGTFAAPESIAAPGSPSSLTLGDLDGDGDRDIAVACFAIDSILVLVNDGTGAFPVRRSLAVAGDPVHVRAALIDDDSRLDLVVCNLDPKCISVFTGIAGGDFAPRVDFALTEKPFATDVGDFDGDGRVDLAIATNGPFDLPANHVTLMHGAVGGGFEPARTSPASRQPRALAVGDFDGDTRLDLAVPGYDSGLAVLRGNGDGTFGTQAAAPTQRDPVGVAFGDLNGDGRGDLAVATFSLDTLTVLIQQPDGSFGARTDYEASAGPLAVTTAQLNPGGFLDVLMVNSASNSVSAYWGNGDGTLQPRNDFETNEGPTSLVSADFDRDGDADVATCNSLTNDVSVLIGRNDGFFDYKADYPTGMRPQQIVVADFDSDSIPDLATANVGDYSVSVLLGRGDGTFEPHVDWTTGPEPQSLAVGDVNRDGALDIIASTTNYGWLDLLQGNGDGTFIYRLVGGFLGQPPVSIALADVGGDGILDLFGVDDATNTVRMQMGFVEGTFDDTIAFGTGANPRAVNLVDVDGDGALDILLTNQGAHQVAVMRNRRDRTPIEVESFAAERRGAAEIELRWRLSTSVRERLDVLRIERAASSAGPWETRLEVDRGVDSYLDRPIEGPAWYRLALVYRDGATSFTSPLEVTVATAYATTLHATAASRDEIRIRFTLARGPADIEIHDVRGRLVRRFVRAATSAGTHIVAWDRTDATGHRTARGVYFVRLCTPSGTPVKRLLLL